VCVCNVCEHGVHVRCKLLSCCGYEHKLYCPRRHCFYQGIFIIPLIIRHDCKRSQLPTAIIITDIHGASRKWFATTVRKPLYALTIRWRISRTREYPGLAKKCSVRDTLLDDITFIFKRPSFIFPVAEPATEL
jgi:hypothetical protein